MKAWRLEENLLTSLPADLLLGVPAERLCLHVARNPLVAPPAAVVATPALLAAHAGVLRRHPEHLASVSVTLWGFGAHGKSRLSDEVLGRRPFPAFRVPPVACTRAEWNRVLREALLCLAQFCVGPRAAGTPT